MYLHIVNVSFEHIIEYLFAIVHGLVYIPPLQNITYLEQSKTGLTRRPDVRTRTRKRGPERPVTSGL